MTEPAPVPRRAWLWVTAAYLFQAIPAAIRDEALPAALKNIGYADSRITPLVSLLGLVLGCKILLAPVVSAFRPQGFVPAAEGTIALVIGAIAALVAGSQPSGDLVIACLVLLSLAAAAHDFALDGYFVAALDDRTRATHSGLLNFASKLGAVLAGPGLIWLAGRAMSHGAKPAEAWSWALWAAAGLAAAAWLSSAAGLRREPPESADGRTVSGRFREMKEGLMALFADARLPAVLGLIFFYRASEVHLARVLPMFSLSADHGGLGLGNETYAAIRMLTAVLGLALGGVIGSQVVARHGLGRSLIPLAFAMHLPIAAIAWLAANGSHDLWTVGLVFFVEYVAYGAGLCALLLAMMKLAAGPGAATRYAALSTFALLANYLPGLWAGRLADEWGYARYFLFALALAVPGLVAAWVARRRLGEG